MDTAVSAALPTAGCAGRVASARLQGWQVAWLPAASALGRTLAGSEAGCLPIVCLPAALLRSKCVCDSTAGLAAGGGVTS